MIVMGADAADQQVGPRRALPLPQQLPEGPDARWAEVAAGSVRVLDGVRDAVEDLLVRLDQGLVAQGVVRHCDVEW